MNSIPTYDRRRCYRILYVINTYYNYYFKWVPLLIIIIIIKSRITRMVGKEEVEIELVCSFYLDMINIKIF